MRRWIAAVLILILLATALCGCKKPTEPIDQEEQGFEKPEDYAVVMSLSVNPAFRLYLSAEEEVLAIEPLNEDAKWVAEATFEKKGSLSDVMEALAAAMKEGGYLQEGAKIELSLTEQKAEKADAEEMLKKAKKALAKGFEALEISVEILITSEETSKEQEKKPPADKKPVKKPEQTRVDDLPADANAIAEDPERIELIKNPTRTVYYDGDLFDPAGMEVIAYYKGGITRKLSLEAVNHYHVREGMTKITLEWNLGEGLSIYSLKVPITVKPALFKITGNEYRNLYKEIVVGETLQLTCTFFQGASGTVRWRSNHEEHAVVDSNGVVTGVSKGTVYIYATAIINGVEYETFPCHIYVDEKPVEEPTEQLPSEDLPLDQDPTTDENFDADQDPTELLPDEE